MTGLHSRLRTSWTPGCGRALGAQSLSSREPGAHISRQAEVMHTGGRGPSLRDKPDTAHAQQVGPITAYREHLTHPPGSPTTQCSHTFPCPLAENHCAGQTIQYCERPSCYHYCGLLSGTLRRHCPVTAAPGLLSPGHTHRAAWETLPAAQLSAEPDRGKGWETLKGGACVFHPIHSTSAPGLWSYAVKEGIATCSAWSSILGVAAMEAAASTPRTKLGWTARYTCGFIPRAQRRRSHASFSTKSTDHRAVCIKPSENSPKTSREPT